MNFLLIFIYLIGISYFFGFFLTLKYYVRNKVQPKCSIIEGYIVEEGIYLCYKYHVYEVRNKSIIEYCLTNEE